MHRQAPKERGAEKVIPIAIGIKLFPFEVYRNQYTNNNKQVKSKFGVLILEIVIYLKFDIYILRFSLYFDSIGI